MVEEIITGRTSTTSSWANMQPRRVLLKLEGSEGIVQGRFAQSSGVIAFRQIDNEGSRGVSTYAVTGMLDGSRFRIHSSAETDRTYEVDAVVNERVIAGRYVAQYSMDGAEETKSGRFEIERL